MAEADQSQAGKGHRHDMVAALYNETAYLVTGRNGGVGSSDESFAQALISGRPFVTFDNIRGRVDSQHLESFLTAPGLFPARVPHRGEVLVDPSGVNLQMSSNGLQSTRDLANRASICRILKRLGFKYRDNLGEIRAGQAYYLGCVFSVITEWVAQGKPRSDDTRHDFREWLQVLDWIVVNIFGSAPLMDDHEAAQERVSNPALSWLRAVAVAMDQEGRLGQKVAANEIVELCCSTGIEIPGLRSPDVEAAARQVGSLMSRLFRDGNEISVEGFIEYDVRLSLPAGYCCLFWSIDIYS